ncbi:MAG: Orotidine 5'-phosphate decarboxylase [Pseudorhodoplanes sp.]|mgnify:CR=1 FL=1|nr:Orotidine 5'-phosphate decarboxylase [Pseudorhodoplanes sp.]GIK79995.1 MAG: orotidine 5'-phosphate decarboxylase [Alphaproteobacteria bacterium]
MKPPARERLIVALDVPSVSEAERLVARVGDAACFYKIGYQLAYAGGLGFAQELVRSGRKVFLDLKLHDIGNTVGKGVESVVKLGVTFLTVHAYPQTMSAALEARRGSPLKIIAVTILTSYNDDDVTAAGYAGTLVEQVRRKAGQARDLGIDGLVCSAEEAAMLREVIGPERLLVTPGIRPAGAATGDQKRIMTPLAAIRAGADHLVVGRPITESPDPKAVAEAIVAEIRAAETD